MSRGRELHDEYLAALNSLGRDLARRARSKCELCGEAGKLVPYDMEGSAAEPSLDHVVLVTPELAEALKTGRIGDANALRFLETAVWSDLAVVRRAAVLLLELIDEPWADEAIENARTMDQSEG